MKKYITILLMLAMLIPLYSVSAAGGAKTIKDYGSFESQASGVFNATMRTVQYSTDTANTGNVSLKAIGTEGHAWALMTFNDIAFENNKTYAVSFYAKSVGGLNTVQAGIYYYVDGQSKYVNGQAQAVPTGKFGEYLQTYAIAEDGDISNAYLRIDVSGLNDTYLDDLVIYEGTIEKEEIYEKTEFTEIQEGETAVNLYVSANAETNGDGSIDNPFSSIEEARDYVRTINENMDKDIVVNIMGGTYTVDETIKLGSADSGRNGHYVIYKAYNNEEVTISGGEKITNWTPYENGIYKAEGVHAPNARNLYVNDKRATRARYESYVTPIAWWNDETNTISEKDGFVIPSGIITDPDKATNLEIYKTITFRCNWAVKGRALDNGDSTIIAMQQPEFYTHERANYSILTWDIKDDFRLENALEFLDKPGEWYLDIDTDTLYYMPKEDEDINTAEIIIPKTETIFDITGDSTDNRAENIIVKGLTFAHGGNDYTSRKGRTGIQSTLIYTVDETHLYQTISEQVKGNVQLENVRNVKLEGNTVKHMSSVGINMLSGAENCEITGNAIYDISSSGITVGANTHKYLIDTATMPKNIKVSNNIITDIGNEYGMDPGIQSYYTDGISIEHNEIYDSGYSGICMGWGWYSPDNINKNNSIVGNRLWNWCTEGKDGGAIYTLGSQPNSTEQYNYVSNKRPDTSGLYHDNGSSYFYDYSNVVDVPGGTTSWITPYATDIYSLTIVDNFTSYQKRPYVSKDVTETGTEYNPGGNWSKAATEAIAQSGLREEYRYLRDIVPNYDTERNTVKRVSLQTEEYDNANPVALKSGETVNLRLMYESESGEISYTTENVTYKSLDESVVKVDGNKCTAVGKGTANVTAKTTDGRESMISVTVDDEGESFKLLATKDKYTVNEDGQIRYSLKTKYWRYTVLPVEFTSSHPHIASVTDMGDVKTHMSGRTRITATVTFDGKTYTDFVDIDVGDAGTATELKLSKYIYEISEDSEITAELKSGEINKQPDGNKFSITAENAEGSGEETDLSEYTDDMKTLYKLGAVPNGAKADATLTENEYVTMLETVSGRNRTEFFADDAADVPLTRERMAKFWSDAVTYIWSDTYAGRPQLAAVSDRTDASAELIPYIAASLDYEMVDITSSKTEFKPKENVSVAQAATTISRMLDATKIRNFEWYEGAFNRYPEEIETMSRRSSGRIRTADNQTLKPSADTAAESNIGLPSVGTYKVKIKAGYKGSTLETNDYCFVYDKNTVISQDKLKTADIGEDSKGLVLDENGKIRIISESGNVWDDKDSFTYAYKEMNGDNYEVSVTIDSLQNTNADSAAGIMVRADNDPSGIKIDYRVKPSGQSFLCWRTAKGGITSYTSLSTVAFPVSLKLVRSGDTYIAYCKKDGEWVKEATSDVPGMGSGSLAGLELYSMTNVSGKPNAAVFGEYYIGDITDKPVIDEPQTQPEEKAEPPEKKEEYVINRESSINLMKNGHFERGTDGWTSNGYVTSGNEAAYSGNSGLIFTPNGMSGYFCFAPTGLKHNKKYILAFKGKTEEKTTSITAYIQYYNGTSTVRCNVNLIGGNTLNSEDWTEYISELTFDAVPQNALLVIFSGSGETVYVDDVELLEM